MPTRALVQTKDGKRMVCRKLSDFNGLAAQAGIADTRKNIRRSVHRVREHESC
jgi:hypothetical protein